MIYCIHPACGQAMPHHHVFVHQWCKNEQHRRCKGFTTVQSPTYLSEEQIVKKHRQEMADADPGQYWDLSELHRREWERYVAARSSRSPGGLASKVWTCRCECHDEVRRTIYLAGAFDLRRLPREYVLGDPQ